MIVILWYLLLKLWSLIKQCWWTSSKQVSNSKHFLPSRCWDRDSGKSVFTISQMVSLVMWFGIGFSIYALSSDFARLTRFGILMYYSWFSKLHACQATDSTQDILLPVLLSATSSLLPSLPFPVGAIPLLSILKYLLLWGYSRISTQRIIW